MAGRSIIDALRRVSAEGHINWVEAFPRVLRAYHSTPGEAVLSPFQILFGRDRYEAGASYEIVRECEGAQQFFDRMEQVDKVVAETLEALHK